MDLFFIVTTPRFQKGGLYFSHEKELPTLQVIQSFRLAYIYSTEFTCGPPLSSVPFCVVSFWVFIKDLSCSFSIDGESVKTF